MMIASSAFSQNDYEILRREVLYDGFLRLVRHQFHYRKFNGNWSETFTREVLERKPAAAILPYDPVRDEIVLIEQFRPGGIANPKSPWLLEIVAGIYDETEKPANVAIREAQEEAGCKILDIYPIYGYFVSPGGSNEFLNLFCGRIDATHAGGFFGLSEEHEDIRAFVVTLDEAQQLLRDNIIQTSPAIIALQWLLLNREWLKELWHKK
jgi:ADP-ribose pyrophosphatase